MTTTLAAGGDAKLKALVLKELASFVQLFGGKRAAADTSSIGLDNTNSLLDILWGTPIAVLEEVA